MWILSGSSNTVLAHTSLKKKRITNRVDTFIVRQVETECYRYKPSTIPQLALNPSLLVFAVYQHAIKDDLSLFTTRRLLLGCIYLIF